MGQGGAYDFTVALLENDDVYVCGRDFDCRLGLGDEHGHINYGLAWVDEASPVKVDLPAAGPFHAIEMQEMQAIVYGNGTVPYGWGKNTDGMLGVDGDVAPTPVPINCGGISDDVCGVAMGTSHTVMLNNSGLVRAMGSNSSGQCSLDLDDGVFVDHIAALAHATLCFTNTY